MNLPFDLPPLKGCADSPVWDGESFLVGTERTPVLEYSENFAGWSDDLTALHEAAAGNDHPIDLASRNDAIRQVRSCMPNSKAVILEIGCSSGFLIKDLKSQFTEALVIGADVVNEPMYKLAKELPGVPLIRFDLLQCPLPDESIDVLVMLNVMEHIEDDVKAFTKAFGLLKPRGSLIIEVPAGPLLYDSYDAELQHFRRYSSRDLKRKLVKAGFIVRRQSHLGFLLYPAFVVVKLLNKWLPSSAKSTVVHKQASTTSESFLVRLGMTFEANYLNNLSLPFGIRALAVATRPE